MADHACPTTHCARPMRAGDVVCHRCWYVLPEDLKQGYRVALAQYKANRSGWNAQALLVAKKRITDSLNPQAGKDSPAGQ